MNNMYTMQMNQNGFPIPYQTPYFQPAQGTPMMFQMQNGGSTNQPAPFNPYVQNNHQSQPFQANFVQNPQSLQQKPAFAEFVDSHAPSFSLLYPSIDDPFELKEIKPSHPVNIPPSTDSSKMSQPPTNTSYSFGMETARRRCKRCSRYYSNDQEECHYHSGHYQSVFQSSLVAGGVMAWGCCRQGDRNHPGCKTGKHIECEKTSANLLLFPTGQPESKVEKLIDVEDAPTSNDTARAKPKITDAVRKAMRERTLANKSLSLDPESMLVNIDGQQYLQHFVEMTDTLRGLSLRYNVPTDEIKSINKLNRDEDLWTRNEILIPFAGQQLSIPDADQFEAQRKARLVRRFKRTAGIQEQEALYYLDTFDYDYDAAMDEYQQDASWEKSHPTPKPMSVKM